MTKVAALLLSVSAAFAQHAVAPPQAGFIEDGSRALRPVYGLAGNFILGRPIAGRIENAAFSGSLGLLKTGSSLAAFNAAGELLASIDAPGGPALLAFSPGGTTALAYLPGMNALIEWRGSAFSRVSFQGIEGTVLAIAFPAPLEATLIVQRSVESLWEVHVPLGAPGTLSESVLSGVRAPLLALPSGDLVYSAGSEIVLRHAGGAEVRIPASLPRSFSLQQMNQNWVELADRNSSARFAIRTTSSREGFYRLPE